MKKRKKMRGGGFLPCGDGAIGNSEEGKWGMGCAFFSERGRGFLFLWYLFLSGKITRNRKKNLGVAPGPRDARPGDVPRCSLSCGQSQFCEAMGTSLPTLFSWSLFGPGLAKWDTLRCPHKNLLLNILDLSLAKRAPLAVASPYFILFYFNITK